MARKRSKKSSRSGRKVIGILLFAVALLLLVSLVTHSPTDDARLRGEIDGDMNPFEIDYRNQAGLAGGYLSWFLSFFFGWLGFFIPIGLLFVSLHLFSSELTRSIRLNSLIIFVLSLLGTMIFDIHLLAKRSVSLDVEPGGGWIAEQLTTGSLKLFGETGSYLMLIGIGLALIIAFTRITLTLPGNLNLPSLKISFAFMKPIVGFLTGWLKAKDETDTDDDTSFASDEYDPENNDGTCPLLRYPPLLG